MTEKEGKVWRAVAIFAGIIIILNAVSSIFSNAREMDYKIKSAEAKRQGKCVDVRFFGGL